MENWKVLLVDDEEDFVTTLAERLKLRGISAIIATAGDEALQLIDSDPPQVVVLDLILPGMGGLDILKQIKRTHPGVQVILLTGRGSTKEGIEGMRLGAYDYLMKPIQIEELTKKINEAAHAGASEGEEEQK